MSYDWRMADIEAWIDAKIAFAAMTSVQRIKAQAALADKRDRAMKALAHLYISNEV